MANPISVPKLHTDTMSPQTQPVDPTQALPIQPEAQEAPAQESTPKEQPVPVHISVAEVSEIKQLVTELSQTIKEIKDTEAPEPDLKPVLEAVKEIGQKVDGIAKYDDSALVKLIQDLDSKIITLSKLIMTDIQGDKKENETESVEAERDAKGKIVKVITKKGGKAIAKEIKRDATGKIIK